ncbi:MAG: DNA-binding protein [Ruminococcus sp.]|nr:DNA-binding protein [Ruminococcus sp.]
MDIEKITCLDQLSGDQREIVETVGLDAYRKLVTSYGGSHVYICKSETVLRELRNSEIRSKFNGYNYHELAKEYNLSEKTVREIVSVIRDIPVDGQMNFF